MSNAAKVTYPLTIYYDASCPLCAAEMSGLMTHDAQQRLNLVDCSAEPMADDAPTLAGISRASMMQAIHARDAHGIWLRGVDVFVAAYGAVGINTAARLWSHPRLRPLWDRLYPWVARNRQLLSMLGASRVIGSLIAMASPRQAPSAQCSGCDCSPERSAEPNMAGQSRCELPEAANLREYQGRGAYADCYVTEVSGTVGLAAFVEAFYTTTLFKVERAILGWLAGRPSSDNEAKQLAEGGIGSFAAWRVEARSADQLLMADFTGRTKSWFMVAPVTVTTTDARTRLYFGSAVVPRVHARTGERTMGPVFHALLGFHRLYSGLLLKAARSRLIDSRAAQRRESRQSNLG